MDAAVDCETDPQVGSLMEEGTSLECGLSFCRGAERGREGGRERERESQMSDRETDSRGRGSDIGLPGSSPAREGGHGQGERSGVQRPDSQVRDARLAHGGGDGFDRGAERVEQLGHLARAAGLPALLHDEAGQGDDIGVEGRLVRHAVAGLLGAGRQVQAEGRGGTRLERRPTASEGQHRSEWARSQRGVPRSL